MLAQEGPLSLARHVANYSRWTVEVRLAAAMLRAKARGAETVGEIVDLIEGFRVGRVAITAWQARSEFESLLKLVKAESPRTVLEIGTALGGTLFGFAQVATRDALLVTVDLPAGRFGGGYHPARGHLYRSFARSGQTIRLVVGDSHEPRTLERVLELLAGRPVDFLFVDGDHTFEGVWADYRLYGPLVRPGGLIAFHDIVPGAEELVGGVPDFWRGFKESRDVTELVESWEQGTYGIGVVQVPDQ